MKARGASAEKGGEGGLVIPFTHHGAAEVKPEFALEGVSGFM